jgi:hypothetical protein
VSETREPEAHEKEALLFVFSGFVTLVSSLAFRGLHAFRVSPPYHAKSSSGSGSIYEHVPQTWLTSGDEALVKLVGYAIHRGNGKGQRQCPPIYPPSLRQRPPAQEGKQGIGYQVSPFFKRGIYEWLGRARQVGLC